MTTFLLFILLAVLAFHVITRLTRRGQLLRKIPGPIPYPIAGNTLQFFFMNNLHDFWEAGRKIMRDYYPISRFWFFHSAFVSIAHPDDLEVLLTSQKAMEKGYVYWYLKPWLKTGLITSSGEKWRNRRKILTPAFHFGILKKYTKTMSLEGKKFIEKLKNDGDETVINLMPFCSRLTLNIIGESSMGISFDEIEQKIVNKYVQAIHDTGKVVLWRMVRPYITNRIISYFPMGKLSKEASKVLHQFTNTVLKKRREYHESTENIYLKEYTEELDDNVFNDIYMGLKKRLAVLDLLLTYEKKGLIDEEGIKEEIDTITFAGHDTTAVAMSYVIMLLAENKEAQERAREEITPILAESNGEISFAQIQQFHYLERCIKESLRLYPPVATIMRYTSEELQLKHALLPADTHILVNFWDTHRDPNFWPNPNKFDPERFLPENSIDRHPFAYIPFSAGPRNCIGQKFAMMELKSVVAQILYDFYLEPVDRTENMKLTADLLLRPLDPVYTKFVRINKRIH